MERQSCGIIGWGIAMESMFGASEIWISECPRTCSSTGSVRYVSCQSILMLALTARWTTPTWSRASSSSWMCSGLWRKSL